MPLGGFSGVLVRVAEGVGDRDGGFARDGVRVPIGVGLGRLAAVLAGGGAVMVAVCPGADR
jgi:hypothetical protein